MRTMKGIYTILYIIIKNNFYDTEWRKIMGLITKEVEVDVSNRNKEYYKNFILGLVILNIICYYYSEFG